MLATKLSAGAAGRGRSRRDRDDPARQQRGFVLLRVLVVFSLVPFSLMAAKFIRYTLPLLATLDLIAAIGLVAGTSWLLRKDWLSAGHARGRCLRSRSASRDRVDHCTHRGHTVLFPLPKRDRRAPQPAGSVFPEETYDYGVREAVAAIAAAARPSAVIVSDADSVVTHYVRSNGRTDIAVRVLSAQGIPAGAPETWVIVQDEHLTFETGWLSNSCARASGRGRSSARVARSPCRFFESQEGKQTCAASS